MGSMEKPNSTNKSQVNEKIDLTELVKTIGFADEYHDIYDPIIHGTK